MVNKYIKSRKDFLLEQDLGMEAAPAEAAPVPVATTTVPSFKFIFIDKKDKGFKERDKYPDGSSELNLPTFSTKEKELTDWVNKNIIDSPEKAVSDAVLKVKRQNIIDLVKGEKSNIADDDIPNIDKLKNAVNSDIFGKREAELLVVFTEDGEPTTENIETTFIKYNV